MTAVTPTVSADHRYVVIEGPIGVGKTSLAQKLAPLMGADLILEHAEDNPFLERFYRCPRTGAYPPSCFSSFNARDSYSNCGKATCLRRLESLTFCWRRIGCLRG